MTSDQERAAPAQQPVAWLGESVGFKSFTRQKAVAERWQKGRIEVTAVYAPSEPELRAKIDQLIKELWPNGLGPKNLSEAATFIKEERIADVEYRDAMQSRVEALSAEVGKLTEALDEIGKARPELKSNHDYSRGWNDALFRVAQMARTALDKGAARP